MQYSHDSVLNSIYRNAETGQQAIFDLIPKVDDGGFLKDIKTQQAEYAEIAQEAVAQLSDMGVKPDPVSGVKKMGMKMAKRRSKYPSVLPNYIAVQIRTVKG